MRRGDSIRKRHLIGTAIAAVTGTLSLWLVGVAPAQASWSSTYDVSASGWMAQDWPAVAVDRQGDSLLVWAACEGGLPYCYHQVQARLKPKGLPMGPIKTLSPLGTVSLWPEVASDDDGDSAVVWQQDGQVVGRRVSASGSVGPLRILSSTLAINPSVAVEPTGRALAVWTEIDGGYTTMARYFARDGTLGPLLALGPGNPHWPAVGISRTGVAVVAWAESNERVLAKRIQPTSVSSTRVIMSAVTGDTYGVPQVGVDRDGDAVLSFHRFREGEFVRVWARRWTKAGTLGRIISVSPSTDNVTAYSSLATDLDGDSMVVWSRRTSLTQTDVFGRRISRTGALGTIARLGVGDRPEVTLDDDGDGMAVWHSPGPPYAATKVYARTISTVGAFGAAVRLSSDGRVPRTDSSPAGRFTVVWQQTSHPYLIRARFGP